MLWRVWFRINKKTVICNKIGHYREEKGYTTELGQSEMFIMAGIGHRMQGSIGCYLYSGTTCQHGTYWLVSYCGNQLAAYLVCVVLR
jgi:hypothetical protein